MPKSESTERTADAPNLTNADLGRIFHEIGDMLEIKGELVFKTVAYHRAADVIERSPIDLVAAYRDGKPPRLAGVGPAISDKLDELATDRASRVLRQAGRGDPARPRHHPAASRASVRRPSASSTPSSASRASRTCRPPPQEGRLRTIRGLSGKTEAQILEGIARIETRSSRMLLDRAEELVNGLLDDPRRARPASRA